MAIAKNAVDASVRVARASSQPPSQPSTTANAIASTTHGARRTISRTTSGEKYRPSATPIAHCPTCRAAGGDSRPTNSMQTSATATSGPISHGSGVPSATQTRAPATATVIVAR